jgi:hypothetical protein
LLAPFCGSSPQASRQLLRHTPMTKVLHFILMVLLPYLFPISLFHSVGINPQTFVIQPRGFGIKSKFSCCIVEKKLQVYGN